MEIILKKKDVSGSVFEKHWDDLEKLYLSLAPIEYTIRDKVERYFATQKLRGKTERGKEILIDQVYYGLASIIIGRDIKSISRITDKHHSTVISGIKRFENDYKLYKDYRLHVRSIILSMPDNWQDKVVKYLGK